MSDIVHAVNAAWRDQLDRTKDIPDRAPDLDVGAAPLTRSFHEKLTADTQGRSAEEIFGIVVRSMRDAGRPQFANYLQRLMAARP